MSDVIKLYPGWKEAAEQIAKKVKAEGYEIILTWEELYDLMDIKVPETATKEKWKEHEFEVLQNMENLKKLLLREYNLHLENVRGVGYQVLHPNDQVRIAPDKQLEKALAHVEKAREILTNVNQEALSFDGQQHQMRGLEKVGFYKAVMGKGKKIIGPSEGGPLSLPEK